MHEAQLSGKDARKLALSCQLLTEHIPTQTGKDRTLEIVNTLGYVQVDTISVVHRSHHHVLWTRQPDYSLDMLLDLQSKDRQVYEYWGHALSCLPMSEYRYSLRRMQKFDDPNGKWEKERFEKYGHLMQPALDRIRQEGALSSADFESTAKSERDPLAHPKPVRAALELLFWRGDLMISERRGILRVYDLAERVLPGWVDTTLPEDDELGEFLVTRALKAYGVAPEKEITNHIHGAVKSIIKKSLKDMTEAGEVVKVVVDGDSKEKYYALPASLDKPIHPDHNQRQLHILSPFDNLIIQRDRLKRLFDFDYVLECYVPAAKRKHGYFVMPVLWGDEIVARLDPKVDRKTKTLLIRNLLFEPGFTDYETFLPQFAEKLSKFAVFNLSEKIIIEDCTPKKVRTELARLLEGK